MTERPNPITLSELLRSIIDAWRELDGELSRVDGKASRGKVESKAPLNLEALDAMREIDTFARTYCHMLMDETDWTPAALNTGALIQGLIDRIGHFTHGDDPQIAYEFMDDVERIHRESWAVARPDGKARIPIGPCFEAENGCPGKVRVLIDRDRPLDSEALALWRPVAVCDKDSEHRIDARIYAHERGRHADVTEVARL